MARWQGEAGWQPEPNHDIQRSKPLEAAASRCSSNLTMAALVKPPDTDDFKILPSYQGQFNGQNYVSPGHQACCYWSGRPGCQWTVIRRKPEWFLDTPVLQKKRELAMNIVIKFKPLSSKGELTTPSLSFMQVAGPNRCFGSCTMSFLPRLREFPIKREAWDQIQTCFKQGRVQPVEKKPHWNLSLERVRKWVVHDELTNCPL